ncbi:MAG: WD40 repeat domain-containing protein [Verrucomicrobia bacterium]|nr:WD40 repeat domain-containing protein [Verrucomicrobiota bacterium]
MNLTKHWAATLEDYVIDLAWSPDGSLLAAAAASGPVTILAGADGAQRHALPGHDGGTNCLGWSPATGAPPLLATGGQDGAVKFWDALAGQHTATAPLGNAWVEHLGWRPAPQPDSATRRPLLMAAAGKGLFALQPDGALAHAFKAAPKTISAVAWQPAGGCVAVSYFGGVCLWDADDFVAQKEFGYNNGIHALLWSPDNRWLVSGNQDPSVHLWVPEEDLELQMSGYEGKVRELSFDHTSRWLATGGGKDCCIWDCAGAGPEGREPTMLPHDAKICAVAFQRSHGLLATSSQDGVLQIWSPERRQPLRATVKMPAAATKLVWSPDDAQLAIGSEKGVIYVLKCEA